MNAKFEKWCEGEKYMTDRLKGSEGLTYYRTSTQNAWNGWSGVIQSLEVTDELQDVFNDAFQDVYDGFNIRYAHRHALRAFISALKEQAK